MRIDQATPSAVAEVALHMRDRDFHEFRAVTPCNSRPALAEVLASRYGRHPGVFVASDEDEPIAVGAALESRPNVATLLFFATPAFPRVARQLTRWLASDVLPAMREGGTHRIEAVSLATYTNTHRWLRTFGLAPEAHLPGYGKAGEPFILFSWVSDAFRPPSTS